MSSTYFGHDKHVSVNETLLQYNVVIWAGAVQILINSLLPDFIDNLNLEIKVKAILKLYQLK